MQDKKRYPSRRTAGTDVFFLSENSSWGRRGSININTTTGEGEGICKGLNPQQSVTLTAQ